MGYGKTRFIYKLPLKSSIWHRYHNSSRMLKKARLLNRPTPARRDAPFPIQGRSKREARRYVPHFVCAVRPLKWILATG